MAQYRANPVTVKAEKIIGVGQITNSGNRHILLDDGTKEGLEFVASPDMLARIVPKVGDYLVTQEDGYQYLNPKDVFERKYTPIVTEEVDREPEEPTGDEQKIDDEVLAKIDAAMQKMDEAATPIKEQEEVQKTDNAA